MRWRLVVAWLLAGSAGPAGAGQLVVRISDTAGQAVGDAVVTVTGATSVPADAPVTRYVDQRGEAFVPYVQVAHPGDRVVFRDNDGTRHHVYSFSEAKAFGFLLRPGESSPPLTLDKAGLVAVGCNIHDHMVAYLLVSAARARVTPPQGRVTFGPLPPGRYSIEVWHPRLRPGQRPSGTSVAVGADGRTQQADVILSLIPDPRGSAGHEHPDY